MNRFAKIPVIETLAIGDELLTGKISDTNSSYVARELFARGLRLSQTQVVADEPDAIKTALLGLGSRARVAICFGGLGPTSDDITVEVVSELLGAKIVEDLAGKTRLEDYLKSRNREMTPQALKQIFYPQGTQPLKNSVGLATPFHCQIGLCHCFFLPGVPSEMKAIVQESVIPAVLKELGIHTKTAFSVWRCIGIPESELQRLIAPLEKELPEGVWTGYRTRPPENYFYLYSVGATDAEAESKLAAWSERIEEKLSPYCYGHSEKELEQVVLELLAEKRARLVCVESCTGGMIVQRLTQVPGASDWVWGGVVPYQYPAKNALLDLSVTSSEEAVSAETSRKLAEAGLEKSGVDISIGVTGYMGPGGGTESDPSGTVYLAVKSSSGTLLEERISLIRTWDRTTMQWASASYGLELLRKLLKSLT